MMISVVVSSFNEIKNPYFLPILSAFNALEFELLVIDGGSTDGTLQLLQKQNIHPIILPQSTRAARLNEGIARATSDYILLNHPRSIIESEGLEYLIAHYQTLNWAVFTHCFDHSHYFLKFISWYSNHVRVRKKHITYLDHCIFLNRQLLDAKLPDIAIFEDTALSFMLQNKAIPVLLPFKVTTSAIRFLDRGVIRQFLMNQWVKCLYHYKINPKKINAIYEKHLNLNQHNE